MKGPGGVAATELDDLLSRIVHSMRRPGLITRVSCDGHVGAADHGLVATPRAAAAHAAHQAAHHAAHHGDAAAAHAAAAAHDSYDSYAADAAAADDEDVTFALETQLSSVGVARAVTSSLLCRWQVTTRGYDVTTVVSELVTNALRHGAPLVAREWVILLRLIKYLDTVMCVVADPNTIAPALREPDFVAETGRGLHVVQAYSRTWGWMPRPYDQGKIVWAVFW
jgi:anti-sigma regulatory factor (Ser/Thr protein kinase)